MAPSFLSAAKSALWFSAAVQAKSYQLSDTYDSTNFLDKFSLFETGNYNDVDLTSGYVSYQGRAEAEELGILKTVGDEFYLGVDAKTKLDPTGIGRSSIRLESKAKYNKGLYIADFTHFPKPTCGTWPAFWTVGQAWPSGGEIDIYEAWNLDAASRIVMHTDAKVGQCGIDGEGMTADMGKPNCAGDAPGQGSGEGCAGLDPSAPYASDKGGVYALEWSDDSIKIWAFTHDNVPADLAENPNPETWGLPRFASAACEVGKVFDDAQIIMNINFCGVAGHEGHWDQCAETTKQTSCQAYIAENPEALKDSYFQVRSIKVYTLGDEKTEYAPPAIESEAAEPTVTSVVVSSPAPEKPQYTDLPEGEEVPSTPVEPEVPVESDIYEQPGTPSIPVEPEVPVESEIYEQPPETPEQPVVSEPVSVEKPIASASASIPEQPVASEPVSAPGQPVVSEPVSAPEQPVASETPSASEQPAQSASASVPDYPIETEPISIVPSESVLPVPTSVPITSSERLTTLTISETRVTTITSCPPEAAAECPGKVGEVVTEVIAVTTTVCPVTDVPTVVTVSKTIVNTVTSCAPDVPDCPGTPSTTIQEEVITTTTAIPVLESSVPVPEPTPEVPTPGEPTPEVPTPEQPTPEVPTPEEPGKPEEPDYPTPEEPTPEEPTPEEPTSQVPDVPVESEKPTPEEPTPEEPTPEEPSSQVPEVPVSEAPTPTITSERLTTLTISETRISTITSCPPEAAADCPGKLGSTITEVVGVTTTVCPVIDVATTVVVSKTIVNTITSCAPEVTNCPVGQPSTTIQEEIITTTTPVVVFEPTGEPTPEEPKPEEPTPEQPIPEQPTPVEPTPEQPTPEEPVTPGEPTTEVPVTPEEPTPVGPVTPEQPTPEYPAPEEPIPETPVPEQPTPENPTPEQPTPEEPTPEQPTPEEPTPEQPTPEEPVPEQPTPEQPTPEEPTPEEPVPQQPTPEEPVTPEQPAPEQPTPEQPTPEEPVTPGQPTPDYPAPEEPVPQPPSPTPSQVVPPPPAIPTFTSIINGTQTAPVTFPTSTDIPVEVDAASKLGSGGLTLLVGAVLSVIVFVL
ncbi:hypothetical protein BN1723_013258 [Verticillium longisporum]|uniref:GH16 domain-containing protein n=1 Tax=Verticillium longisporum TaxID=100787 RepID=A0A0G4LRS4_VERLO|nr:hypothetical protein BN1723_013258 [Verticillium longisporum]